MVSDHVASWHCHSSLQIQILVFQAELKVITWQQKLSWKKDPQNISVVCEITMFYVVLNLIFSCSVVCGIFFLLAKNKYQGGHSAYVNNFNKIVICCSSQKGSHKVKWGHQLLSLSIYKKKKRLLRHHLICYLDVSLDAAHGKIQ